MKISKKTLDILKNFSSINNSLYFPQGKTISTVSVGRNIAAVANVDVEFEREFCIYDLNRFISTLSLLDDPDIVLQDNYLEIVKGKRKINYTYCSKDFITLPPEGIENKLKIEETKVSFSLDSKDLQILLKAASVMKLPNVCFVGSEGKIHIKTNTKTKSSDVFNIEVGETNERFSIVFDVELFKMIVDNYEVKVNNRFAQFVGSGVSYWLAVKTDESEF